MRTEGVQARLAAIWCELLDRTAVGLDDDFYTLGGHSIFILQLLDRVTDEFDVEVTVEDVFTLRTVRALAARIDTLDAARPAGSTMP